MKLATSTTVLTKADNLYDTVEYLGRGRFVVAGSKSDHVVTMPAPCDFDAEGWRCDCEWSAHNGRLCSHVRAAHSWALDVAYGDAGSLAQAA